MAYCAQGKVMESSLASSWYPANSGDLTSQINKYLDKVKEKRLKDVIALILPHAGYYYSGQTAAYGVKELQGKKYSRVIILGPSHRRYMRNEICIPNFTAFKTPLGEIPVDTAFIKKIEKEKHIITSNPVHALEHSIQIQLPLLQKALGKFKLVPIVVGQLDNVTAQKIANMLLSVIDKNTLIIVSSDFTHYGKRFNFLPFPPSPLLVQTEKKIKQLDMGAVKKIENIDFGGFYNYVNKTDVTICGSSPILILLAMLPKDCAALLLHYDTSGKQLGSFENSVSYVSMAFAGKWSKLEKKSATQEILTKSDKKKLAGTRQKNTRLLYGKQQNANTERAWNNHNSKHAKNDGCLRYFA